ncbi:hypothetical protein AB0N17_46645, partial [Streptomyces sp. NPDC051133]|uniref:hypothetical protein n=1 Tax=Streptomyces sp. NPDC051133 TaxID=3155521 RepID=UPI003420C581
TLTENNGPNGQEISFTINGPYAARAVIIDSNAMNLPPNSDNLFNYQAPSFPHGLSEDHALHAPVNPASPTGEYFGVGSFTLCAIASNYNG